MYLILGLFSFFKAKITYWIPFLSSNAERVIDDKTFFAEIHFETADGVKTISSRPSDAIALAVRMSSPIYAEEEVLATAGHKIREDNEDTEEDVLAEFRDFLDDVSPEDF